MLRKVITFSSILYVCVRKGGTSFTRTHSFEVIILAHLLSVITCIVTRTSRRFHVIVFTYCLMHRYWLAGYRWLPVKPVSCVNHASFVLLVWIWPYLNSPWQFIISWVSQWQSGLQLSVIVLISIDILKPVYTQTWLFQNK